MIDILSGRFQGLTSWRPLIWEEFKLARMLPKYVLDAFKDIQKQARVFADAVFKDECDEDTLNKLESSYSNMVNDWHMIMNTKKYYKHFTYEIFKPSPEELKDYHSYVKAAFLLFYQCSSDIADARIQTGKFDPSEKASFLQTITSQRY